MKIAHIALFTNNLESLRAFYQTYFGARCSNQYTNPGKQFSSYFLTFDEGCTLEIMTQPGLADIAGKHLVTGLAHFAISVGSKEKVIKLTDRLRNDGYLIAGEPRTTGDGFFESVVCDPDNNRVEITI